MLIKHVLYLRDTSKTLLLYHFILLIMQNLILFPMSIIDQEKALDRVNHQYLFRILKAFGLGNRFISLNKLCYVYMFPVFLIL